MLLLLYNDNETNTSVGHPLWAFSMNGDDLAWAHSNPPQQTTLVTKQDAHARPAGTKLQMLSLYTTTYITYFDKFCHLGPSL